MWRLRPASATSVLMIEATNTDYTLPDKGLLAPTRFDPGVLDTEADDAFKAHQRC